MPKTRLTTQDNFRENLRKLIAVHGISNRELARRTNGRVSDRYIGMILNGDYVPTIEMAQYIGEAFGLTGWHMIMPNLPYELARTGKLDRFVEGLPNTPADTQEYIAGIIAREAAAPYDVPKSAEEDGPNIPPAPAAPPARPRRKKV